MKRGCRGKLYRLASQYILLVIKGTVDTYLIHTIKIFFCIKMDGAGTIS